LCVAAVVVGAAFALLVSAFTEADAVRAGEGSLAAGADLGAAGALGAGSAAVLATGAAAALEGFAAGSGFACFFLPHSRKASLQDGHSKRGGLVDGGMALISTVVMLLQVHRGYVGRLCAKTRIGRTHLAPGVAECHVSTVSDELQQFSLHIIGVVMKAVTQIWARLWRPL
jgi:hypothetical protein